jgi:hypothetical protein
MAPSEFTAEQIRAWLTQTGGSFEMQVARIMHARQLSVQQSHYYIDPDEPSKSRETDVVVSGSLAYDTNALLELHAVIECKYAPTPWVLYRETGANLGSHPHFNRIATKLGSSWLTRRAMFNEQINTQPLFQREPNVGYGLGTSKPEQQNPRQGTRDVTTDPAADLAYKAMFSVAKATLALAAQLEEHEYPRRVAVFFPVIAIRGQLFEASLSDGNEIIVNEITRGQVNWSHPASPTGRVLIDIVTAEALHPFANDLKAAVEAMHKHGVDSAREVVMAYETEQEPHVYFG